MLLRRQSSSVRTIKRGAARWLCPCCMCEFFLEPQAATNRRRGSFYEQIDEGADAMRCSIEEHEDGLTIRGTGGEQLTGTPAGAAVETMLDHRIAMSMAVAGLVSAGGVTVDDTAPIATSFPTFMELLEGAAQ